MTTVSDGRRRTRTSASSSNAFKCSKCWCFAVTLCCASLFWILDSVAADCWYEEERHNEGIEVATIEPCLNCTCSKGVLICYLRVCPKLPNPPPPGCILLHRYRTCCPELICAEMPSGGNALEARSEPDDNGIEIYDRKILRNACVVNGSIYAPGSAMDSSSLCEYCYCLAGKETCVKPKCLLPIEGCTPIHDPTSCCPVRYNCTKRLELSSTTSSTTTLKPYPIAKGGCMIDNIHYPEGGKVLGMGHSICDNCYCIQGLLRCEPLSCAPPLLGCSPIIKAGECCAASYNCSGTIEIQAKPHYGEFPTVSKEYAKLRKEVHQRKPTSISKKTAVVTENSNMPFYVIAESEASKTRVPGSFGTTRHFTGLTFNPSTVKPFYYSKLMDNNNSNINNKHSTRSYTEKKPEVYYATTNYEFQNKNYKRPFSTTNKPLKATTKSYKEEKLRSSDYLDLSDESLLSIVDSLLDVRLNRKVENETTTTEFLTTTTDDKTEKTTTLKDELTTILDATTTEEASTTEPITTTSANDLKPNQIVTVKTVTNTTECRNSSNTLEVTTVLPVDANEINKLAELKTLNYYTTTTDFSSEETTEGDVTEVNLESRVKVSGVTMKSLGKLQPDIEAILNITKHKDNDYDYDYNEPSLPPSLPNLKIIPFVAADALDSKNQISKDNNIYPQDRISSDVSFGYSNLFNPPSETEGGFVPKEPPILENFYENAVTMPSITNPPKSTELDCLTDTGKIPHGQPTNSESPCTTCTCFYGNIICQKPECPSAPRPNCRESSVQDLSLCCPTYICDDEEAPTVVLDRLENGGNPEVVTIAEGVSTHDPFRDVIRTEPAPDLQSLMVDMVPFLARKTTPIPSTTTTEQITTTLTSTTTAKNNSETLTSEDDDEFSLDKVLQLLFSANKEETTTSTVKTTTTTSKKPPTTTRTTTIPTTPSTLKTTKQQPKPTEPSKRQKAKNKTRPNNLNSVDSSPPGVGLKLSGCNIYGKMYTIGKTISELSGPCLECKCTEAGIQCKRLKCWYST